MTYTNVLFVCHGNICRSPLGEFVFRDMVEKAGRTATIKTESCGISGCHQGECVDRRSAGQLSLHGISCSGKRARKLVDGDFEDFQYIACMDRDNLDWVLDMAPRDCKAEIRLLLDYCGGGEVDDPYYTGDFEKAYRDVERGCRALLERILSEESE